MACDLTRRDLFESRTLFSEMALLRPNAVAKAAKAFEFVHRHGIPAVLIGGMAVSHWTADRALTPDADFLVGNLDAVKRALMADGLTWRPLAADGPYDGIMCPELDADFLDAEVGNVAVNRHVLATARPQMIGGLPIPVADRGALAAMKFDTVRDKDTDDALKLIRGVDLAAMKTHLRALKPALQNTDAKTIWQYAQMLR